MNKFSCMLLCCFAVLASCKSSNIHNSNDADLESAGANSRTPLVTIQKKGTAWLQSDLKTCKILDDGTRDAVTFDDIARYSAKSDFNMADINKVINSLTLNPEATDVSTKQTRYAMTVTIKKNNRTYLAFAAADDHVEYIGGNKQRTAIDNLIKDVQQKCAQ